MRYLSLTLAFVAATFAITACAGKSSSSASDQTNAAATTSSDNSSDTSASTAPSAEASAAASPATGGDVPTYPGATTQASGSSSNMGSSAAGTVMSTDDSFDKVYQWYQQNMPAGSEKSHVTAPVEGAVFTVGQPGQGQTSVTLSTSGGKTMITIAHVKM